MTTDESGQTPTLPEPTGLSEADLAYLLNAYNYHPATGEQPARYERVRAAARLLADVILRECPSSRERSLALTQCETSMFWANASIARERREGEGRQ